MILTAGTIKTLSKKNLKNNFLKALTVSAVVLFVFFINYNIASLLSLVFGDIFSNVIFGVGCFLTFSPVLLGAIRYFWRMACAVTDNPISVFYYFSSKQLYKKSLSLAFSILVRALISYIIFIIPAFAFDVISGTKIYELLGVPIPIWSVNLSYFSFFLKFIAVVATLLSVLKFYLAPMLIVADENMVVAEAMHLSTVISKKSMLDFIFFVFAFLGWILLSVLIIPLFFVLPYFLVSYLLHCSSVVNEFNEEIKKLNQDDLPTIIAGV